jgi:hypothetical protein
MTFIQLIVSPLPFCLPELVHKPFWILPKVKLNFTLEQAMKAHRGIEV